MEDFKKYIDRENALRYMGCRGEVPGSLLRVVCECEEELCGTMTPRSVFRAADISLVTHILAGEDIKNHLEGCGTAVFFAATLGEAVDSLIRKYQFTDVAKALIIDAEASAAVEKLCDEVESSVVSKFRDRYFTWRFSPGYGDFPIGCQRALLDFCDAGRRTGIYCSEGMMLTPSKSVTAVIGISDAEIKKEKRSCAMCAMSETCKFRKEASHCGS